MKKPKPNMFTLLIKVVTVVDYEVPADTFEQAVEASKSVAFSDLLSYTPDTTENGSSLSVVGIYAQKDWGI